MKKIVIFLVLGLFLNRGMTQSAELVLRSPLEYQVVQRTTRTTGTLPIRGELDREIPASASIEVKLIRPEMEATWEKLPANISGKEFSSKLELPAGGWWGLEVRIREKDETLAHTNVKQFGVGEVFVIAGQSNSANHGEEKLSPQSGLVTTFDGRNWRIAHDPQPGASGGNGSFIPAFADEIVKETQVPVGIVACGIGATSVREWLPKGATFPNPPTLLGRVEQLPSGEWASKGAAFEMFVTRMKSLGPRGFRAVLWHQGESDANQKDATRTLPGKLYREYLEQLMRESRTAIGWEAPWFVAQASYHVPGDEGSDDIRAAQASLWKDRLAFAGPDSDALKGELREGGGRGVHFSGKGLRVHGAKWAEKVWEWLEKQP